MITPELAHALATACPTVEGSTAIAKTLGADAPAAMAWVIAHAGRTDLALAPLISGVSIDARIDAAVARLVSGPLHDGLACLPIVFAAGRCIGAIRRRVDTLFWELAARGEGMASLGAWLSRDPAAARELVLDAAAGDLAARMRAVRALAVMADGVADEANLLVATQLADLATTWLEHPEPLMWTVAAHALGGLAGRGAAAHHVLQSWSTTRVGWRRRRIAAAIAAVPRRHAGLWIDDALATLVSDEMVAGDPWRTAALGTAARHLARDHGEHWQRLLELAKTGPFEIASSVAHGLATLGRVGAGRGLSASEQEAIVVLRKRLATMPRRSTDDATRAYDCEVQLRRAIGEPAPAVMVFESADDAIHALVAGRPSSVKVTPGDAFAAAVGALEATDDSTRGTAHAILRSATRAHASRIVELVGGVTDPDLNRVVVDEVTGRLEREIGAVGLRKALVACLGDIVDGAGDHGRVAASALRAVATSRWARQEVVEGPDAPARSRAVQRFREPLDDLLGRCTSRRPPVPGPLAAWWAVCAGGGALVVELDRDADDAVGHGVATAAIAAIERLRDAHDRMPAWSEVLLGALAALGAGDTLLARAIAQLAMAVDQLSGATELAAIGAGFDELSGAMAMYLAVASDVDAALFVGRAPRAPEPRGAPHPDRRSSAASLARWEAELPAAIGAIVLPLARGALAALARPRDPRGPGMQIGNFELIERLGGGRMGEVWKARRGRQIVALKLPDADATPHELDAMAQLLGTRASRLESLPITKVVSFTETGVDGQIPFLATRYLRGRTLHEHVFVVANPIDHALVRRIARDLCTGLANLHELGVVHRDVTPSNVFLRFRGQDPSPLPTLAQDPLGRSIDDAVLIDLGIAQQVSASAFARPSFGYVAPEILAGAPVSPAADVYALGATLFHVLTGRRFAEGLPASRAAEWHTTVEPFDDADVRAAVSHLPPRLAALLASATRLEPSQRPTLKTLDAELAP